jgi:hypothetical protein
VSLLCRIDDGFECSAGRSREGWYVASLKRHACDEGYLAHSEPEKYHLLDGVSQEQWYRALDDLQVRKLVLTDANGTDVLVEDPQRIIGPCCPAAESETPVVAWAQKSPDAWQIRLLQHGQVRTVMATASAPSRLAVEVHNGQCFLACEMTDGPRRRSVVLDEAGKEVFQTFLRYPSLCSTGEKLYLLGERIEPDRIVPEMCNVLESSEPVRLNAPSAYAYKGRMLHDPRRGTLYLAAELSDRWGHFELIGIHRQLGLWQLSEDATRWVPAEATCNGLLPCEVRSAASHVGPPVGTPRYTSCPPITPVPALVNGQLLVAYRQFAPRGNKEFGWDVLAITRRGWGWSQPVRLNGRLGSGDTPYFLLSEPDRLLLVHQAYDQDAIRTFQEEAEGQRSHKVPQPIRNPAVEVLQVDPDDAPGPRPIPSDRVGVVLRPPDWENIAPAPPEVDTGGPELLWTDIHNHTMYSKCMASMDGSPEEMVRFQRDVLGCRVLTFTDHFHLMNQREVDYHYDMLEAEAGDDCIVLYGCEPGTFPDHHTNFYAIDRDVAHRLWRIVYRFHARNEIYRRIREELPAGSVAVMRHFHGWNWQGGDANSDLIGRDWAPDLEVAAEAMQNRGCALLNHTPRDRNLPAFPANFYNKGAKMGLVAGSDHNGGNGILHYCITGIWVDKPDLQGVWDAIWSRRTQAGQNGKIAVWTTCNGQPMGSEVQAVDRVRVELEACSARPLRRCCLMVDGQLEPWVDLDSNSVKLTLETKYYGPSPAWICAVVEGDSAYQDSAALTFSTPHFLCLPSGETQ